MLDDIAEGIIKFVAEIILETICFYTGEIILFIFHSAEKSRVGVIIEMFLFQNG